MAREWIWDGSDVTGDNQVNGEVAPASTVNALRDGLRVALAGGTALDRRPSTPHAENDEFDGTAIDGSWTLDYTPSASEPAPHANFTSGDPRVLVRNGTLFFQPVMGGAATFTHKAITVDTNFLAMAKIRIQDRDITPGAIVVNEVSTGIQLSQSSGAALDLNNRVWIQGYTPQIAGVPSRYGAFKTVGGSQTQLEIGPDVKELGLSPLYYSILKIGTTYNFWVHNAGGGRTYIGSFVEAGISPDRVAIWSFAANHGIGTAPNPIIEYDWVRFETLSGDVLPNLWG